MAIAIKRMLAFVRFEMAKESLLSGKGSKLQIVQELSK
jgi:hypothetical protein